MQKGQCGLERESMGSQSSSSVAGSQSPARSIVVAMLKSILQTPCETLTSEFTFLGKETETLRAPSPEASRLMLNNGFSLLPCRVSMEKQVESSLQLQVRRVLIMPALQMRFLSKLVG